MTIFKSIFLIASLATLIGFSSCSTKFEPISQVDISSIAIADPSQAMVELNQLNGDYINAKGSPYLLDVSDVYLYKSQYLLLDLRSVSDYESGHIDGAIRVERSNLLDYLKKNNPETYEKVILIDNTGFESAYAASILRAVGYSQVYPLKNGMAVWNKQFASNWTNALSNKYSNQLETTNNSSGKKRKLPEIKTSATTAVGVLEEQATRALKEDFMVNIDDVMNDPSAYYLINYWPKDLYQAGHLKGAIWFNPKTSLKLDADLANINPAKKIAVYCYTGLTASAMVGYLRLLGYDAYNIGYGANGFMYNTLKTKKWHAFDIAEKGNDYPLTKGSKPSEKKAITTNSVAVAAPAAPITRTKKATGGGGCD